MSESNNGKAKAGAMELRKACLSLLSPSDLKRLESLEQYTAQITKNVSSPIMIHRDREILTIAKCTCQTSLDTIEFQFKFRLAFAENRTEWWPVFFNDSSGRSIEAETKLGERVLTNVQKQNQLIDLTNTWAKSLSSQALTRSIDGII